MKSEKGFYAVPKSEHRRSTQRGLASPGLEKPNPKSITQKGAWETKPQKRTQKVNTKGLGKPNPKSITQRGLGNPTKSHVKHLF